MTQRDSGTHSRENADEQRTDTGDNQQYSKGPTEEEISCCKQHHVSWALKGVNSEIFSVQNIKIFST